MRIDFNALPALIALAILVAVFAAISRHHTRERVRLWLAGWILVLLRAAVQFLNPPEPAWFHLNAAISLCSLELAGIAFVVSVSPRASTRRRQLALGLILGLPALAYTNAMIAGIEAHAFYYAVVAAGCLATLIVTWYFYRKPTVYVACV